MKIALIQQSTSPRLDENIGKMRRLIEEAKRKGAGVVAFPEMAYFTGTPAECSAVIPRYSELMGVFSGWAKELGLNSPFEA